MGPLDGPERPVASGAETLSVLVFGDACSGMQREIRLAQMLEASRFQHPTDLRGQHCASSSSSLEEWQPASQRARAINHKHQVVPRLKQACV
jgi:hypothetical protein